MAMSLGFEIEQLRWSSIILGISNLFLIIISLILIDAAYPDCGVGDIIPFILISFLSCLRLATMVPIAIAQRATAMTIINTPSETRAVGTLVRRHQRVKFYVNLMLLYDLLQ